MEVINNLFKMVSNGFQVVKDIVKNESETIQDDNLEKITFEQVYPVGSDGSTIPILGGLFYVSMGEKKIMFDRDGALDMIGENMTRQRLMAGIRRMKKKLLKKCRDEEIEIVKGESILSSSFETGIISFKSKEDVAKINGYNINAALNRVTSKKRGRETEMVEIEKRVMCDL